MTITRIKLVAGISIVLYLIVSLWALNKFSLKSSDDYDRGIVDNQW